MSPQWFQWRRTKGWRKPEGAVFVARFWHVCHFRGTHLVGDCANAAALAHALAEVGFTAMLRLLTGAIWDPVRGGY